MAGVEQIPLRIPRQWDAEWFAIFVGDVLSKMDTRNATGSGIVISSNGNSVATLSATASIEAAIDEHDATATAHTTQIAAAISTHDAEPTAHEDQIEAALDVHRVETDPHAELIDDLPTVTAVYDTDRVLVGQDGVQRTSRLEQVRDLIFGDHWTDIVIPAVGINPLSPLSRPEVSRKPRADLLVGPHKVPSRAVLSEKSRNYGKYREVTRPAQKRTGCRNYTFVFGITAREGATSVDSG